MAPAAKRPQLLRVFLLACACYGLTDAVQDAIVIPLIYTNLNPSSSSRPSPKSPSPTPSPSPSSPSPPLSASTLHKSWVFAANTTAVEQNVNYTAIIAASNSNNTSSTSGNNTVHTNIVPKIESEGETEIFITPGTVTPSWNNNTSGKSTSLTSTGLGGGVKITPPPKGDPKELYLPTIKDLPKDLQDKGFAPATLTWYGPGDEVGSYNPVTTGKGNCLQNARATLGGGRLEKYAKYFAGVSDGADLFGGELCYGSGMQYPICSNQQNCGRCYELKCLNPLGPQLNGPATDECTDKTATVLMVDACPAQASFQLDLERQYGWNGCRWGAHHNYAHFDVSAAAMNTIRKGTGGQISVVWREVEC